MSQNNGTSLYPYLDLLRIIITINDQFKQDRIENLLGFPNQKIQTESQFYIVTNLYQQQTLYLPINQDITNPDNYTNYQTLLQSIIINFKPNDYSYSIVIQLNALLSIMNSDPVILDYVMHCPPPFITCAYYTDWVLDYIQGFICDCQKNFTEGITNAKIQLGEETAKLMKQVQA